MADQQERVRWGWDCEDGGDRRWFVYVERKTEHGKRHLSESGAWESPDSAGIPVRACRFYDERAARAIEASERPAPAPPAPVVRYVTRGRAVRAGKLNWGKVEAEPLPAGKGDLTRLALSAVEACMEDGQWAELAQKLQAYMVAYRGSEKQAPTRQGLTSSSLYNMDCLHT